MESQDRHHHVPRPMAVVLATCLAFLFVALSIFGLHTTSVKAGPNDIGLVLDPDGPDDNSFNEISIQGLNRAESELGVNGTVYQTTGPADYQAAFNQCVSDGNALCIGVGWLLYEAISNTASLNPGVNFALLDITWEAEKANLRGIGFNIEEAAYLAGILAGSMTEEDRIGAIGGMAIDPVDRFIDGYWNGARCTNPAVTTWITYTNNFADPGQGDAVARHMINNGVDVIHAPAGDTGNGALLAAAELDKWAIGFDVDHYYTTFMGGSATGSDHLLTSVLKHLDNAVYQTIQDQLAGNFSGGNVWLGLAEEGVGLAPYHEAGQYIPLSVMNEITATRQALINGQLDVYGACLSDYEYELTDYFDHPSLTPDAGGIKPILKWVRQDTNNWSLDEEPGFLRITTQNGGLAGPLNDQRNLLVAYTPQGNYQITTKVEISPTQNYQHAGLMVYYDENNYIQINRAYVNGGTLNFDLEVGGVVNNTQIPFTSSEVYLRIVKVSTRYTGLYSEDGNTWTQLGQVTANFISPRVGIGATNDLDGVPSIPADFAFFKLEGVLPTLYTAYSDTFDSPTLNSAWSWMAENPAHWSLTDQPGYMRILTHPGTFDAENLLFQTPLLTMYDVRTRLIFTPQENFQIAGLSLFQDGDNYITLGRAFCQDGVGTCVGNGIYFDCVDGGNWHLDNFATRVHDPESAHLRIFRYGGSYSGFYSPDGVRWQYLGLHRLISSMPDLKLGLATGQDIPEANLPADFDHFLLKADAQELHLPVIVRQAQAP